MLRVQVENIRVCIGPGCDSQFEFIQQDGVDCIRFTEDVSMKTNRGGLKCVALAPKQVIIFPAINVQRCPVRLYKKYISKLPSTLKYKELYF